MTQNRIPFKLDKEANEKNLSYSVSAIKLELDENGYGEFEVLLSTRKSQNAITKKATGQITIREKDTKVETFFLSNIVDVKNNKSDLS